MTGHDDFDRTLADWFQAEALSPPPDGGLDRILDATRGRRPRPAWLSGIGGDWVWEAPDVVSSPGLRSRLVWAIVVVALVAALAAAAALVGSRLIEKVEPSPKFPPAIALDPGTYFLPNPYTDDDPVRSCARGCADYKQIIFTLPAGWTIRDGLVAKHRDQPGEVAFSAWTVDQVYADPCHWQAGVLGSAPGEQDLATRLRNEAGRDPSAPTEVSLGGVPALRIELSTPTQLDTASCDGGEFRSWSEWDVDGTNSHNAPGQLDVVYVVDVDRRPLVIDASHMPAASKQDLAELEAVLASMIIDRGPAWGAPDTPFPSARPIVVPSPPQAVTTR